MSLLAVYTYYLYQRRPEILRLLLTGLCCGLAFSVKHSGVLMVPVLVLLTASEVIARWRARRPAIPAFVLRQAAALLLLFAIAVGVLWTTYLFRYTARPSGAALTLSLAAFIADTTAKSNRSFMLHIIPVLAHFHLLPEAYLYGFVDVLSISNPGQSSSCSGTSTPTECRNTSRPSCSSSPLSACLHSACSP